MALPKQVEQTKPMKTLKVAEEKHSLEVLFGDSANLTYPFLQESTISLVSKLSINIIVTIVTPKKDYLEDKQAAESR